MNDKFLSILASDTFAPRLPLGSRLMFQRGREAKPGDIVAVTYTDDENDFSIEPYREGVVYFAVAIRAAKPRPADETPSDDEETKTLSVAELSRSFAALSDCFMHVVRGIEQVREGGPVEDIELTSLHRELMLLSFGSWELKNEVLELCKLIAARCAELGFPAETAQNPSGFDAHHIDAPQED